MNEQEKQAMINEMNKDKQGGNKKFWGPKSKEEGTFSIRFLPPMKKLEETKFYFSHKIHFIGGIPFECLNQSFEDVNGNYHEAERCPICSYTKKLYSTSERDSDEWKLAGQIKAKQRYLSRVIVRDKDQPEQPEFYEYGPTVWKKLYHIIVESDFGNIIDPKIGRDFNLVKTGTGRNSEYSTSTPAANNKPVFDDKEKLLVAFEKASQMKYNSLLEFRGKEEMTEALNEYLGLESDTPKNKVASKPATKKEEPAEDSPMTEDYQDKEAEATDEDIDDILSEFTD
jgi:hypothetical protein